jgi:type IV secretory pathway VirB4 component
MRRRTKPFQEAVPWRHAVAPGVIRNSDQSLMRCYAIRGSDLAGLSRESQGSIMQRLNMAFRRLPGQWSFHLERQRVQVRALPVADVDDPVLKRLDERRRQQILEHPTFESRYVLTIRRRPLVKLSSMALELLMTRPALPRLMQETTAEVAEFEGAADHFAHLLSRILSSCTPLVGTALTTYLHSTCSNRWHTVAHPRTGANLHYALCDARFVGGWEPTLGMGACAPQGTPCRTHWHVAFCSVINFPHDSRASLLYRLDHLPFEHRQMTRWIAWPVQQSRKLFRETENVWVSKQQSPFAHFMASQGYASQVSDSHATNQAEDADAANQEVSGAYVGYGEWTSTVMVWGHTVDEAEARIQLVREVFEDEDFTVYVEDEHTMAALKSMLPGNVKDSARRYPVSSINLAHMEPSLKAYWPGPEGDAHLNAGPWMLAHTEGSTLFRVVNHVLDVGHFAIIGSTGMGKSTLLAIMTVCWLMQYRPQRARVVVLDIGRSMRALTLCLGGQYDDLTDGSVHFQPFADVHDPVIRRLRLEWLMDRFTDYGVERTTITEGAARTALDQLAQVPMASRTLQEFGLVLAAKANVAQRGVAASMAGDERGYGIKLTTKQVVMGQYEKMQGALDNLRASGLFDGTQDRFRTSRLHVTEIGTLLDEMRLANAVLPYLKQRQRATFTGDPVLFLEDEHALQVTLPQMEEEAKRDLRSLRKVNVSLGIATHDVVDLFDSQMGKLIINSCRTRFLLANSSAPEEEVAETYRRLGCTDTEIEEIARMHPQGEYYLQQSYRNVQRRRKFSIRLQGLWLALCGSSSQADQDMMDFLLETHQPGPDFAAAFVEQKALQWKDEALMAEAKVLREVKAYAAD